MKVIGRVVSDFNSKKLLGVMVTDGKSMQPMTIQVVGNYVISQQIDNYLGENGDNIMLKGFNNDNIPMFLGDGTPYTKNPIVVIGQIGVKKYSVVTPFEGIVNWSISSIQYAIQRGYSLANARIVDGHLIEGYRKQRPKFEIYQNLKDCKDSMLFNAGERIAKYGTDDDYVLLTVYGEVRVEYNGEYYFRASDMPQALIDMFENGRAYDSDYVYIGNNNWFDYVHIINGEIQHNDIVCESDISKMTTKELRQEMIDMYNYFHEGE